MVRCSAKTVSGRRCKLSCVFESILCVIHTLKYTGIEPVAIAEDNTEVLAVADNTEGLAIAEDNTEGLVALNHQLLDVQRKMQAAVDELHKEKCLIREKITLMNLVNTRLDCKNEDKLRKFMEDILACKSKVSKFVVELLTDVETYIKNGCSNSRNRWCGAKTSDGLTDIGFTYGIVPVFNDLSGQWSLEATVYTCYIHHTLDICKSAFGEPTYKGNKDGEMAITLWTWVL